MMETFPEYSHLARVADEHLQQNKDRLARPQHSLDRSCTGLMEAQSFWFWIWKNHPLR